MPSDILFCLGLLRLPGTGCTTQGHAESLTIVLLSALISFSQTKRLYESRAKLLVSLGTEVLGKADYVNGRNVMLLQREQQIHNEQQILESHEVMLTAAHLILGDPTQFPPAPPTGAGTIDEARRF